MSLLFIDNETKYAKGNQEFESLSIINLDHIAFIRKCWKEDYVDSECGIEGDGVIYIERGGFVFFSNGNNVRINQKTMELIEEEMFDRGAKVLEGGKENG